MTDARTVARVAARLAIYWPTFEVTESWKVGAHDLFDGIAPDRLEAAVRKIAEDGRDFPPTVGLIAKTAREATGLPYHRPAELPEHLDPVEPASDDVKREALAEARARLRALPSIKRIGEAL